MTSALRGDRVHLAQGLFYRARLEVVPPFGAMATEAVVRAALEKHGFADVRFYAPDGLPVDWPNTERLSDVGLGGKTFYLEGRFARPAASVEVAELGRMVRLRDLWER